jgi:hypothetical protein
MLEPLSGKTGTGFSLPKEILVRSFFSAVKLVTLFTIWLGPYKLCYTTHKPFQLPLSPYSGPARILLFDFPNNQSLPGDTLLLLDRHLCTSSIAKAYCKLRLVS